MWGTLFTTFSGTGLLEFVSLMGVVGTFARTCGCGFFMRIFWCGFLDADFWVRIFLADFGVRIFFRGFCDGLCGFWVRIFSADFLGCFPAEKALKKSHQKIPPKNPHQRSSPRSVSSQYTTTLPSGQTQQISSGSLGADAPCGEPFCLRSLLLSGRMNV